MTNQPHWAVCYLLNSARERNIAVRDLERRAGLAVNTIHRWSKGRTPNLPELEQAFGAMDLRLGVMTLFR